MQLDEATHVHRPDFDVGLAERDQLGRVAANAARQRDRVGVGARRDKVAVHLGWLSHDHARVWREALRRVDHLIDLGVYRGGHAS